MSNLALQDSTINYTITNRLFAILEQHWNIVISDSKQQWQESIALRYNSIARASSATVQLELGGHGDALHLFLVRIDNCFHVDLYK